MTSPVPICLSCARLESENVALRRQVETARLHVGELVRDLDAMRTMFGDLTKRLEALGIVEPLEPTDEETKR